MFLGTELGSIISSAAGSMRAYSLKAARQVEMVGKVLNMEEFLSAPNSLFIVVPPNAAKIGAPIVLGLIDALQRAVIKVSDRNGGKLPIPIYYALDEIANITPIDPDRFGHMLSESVGRNCNYQLALQSYSQGVKIWGEAFMNEIPTLVDAVGVMGGLKDFKFLDDIASLIGADKVAEYHNSTGRNRTPLPKHLRKGHRLTNTELAELKKGYIWYKQGSNPPEKVKTMFWEKTKPFDGWLERIENAADLMKDVDTSEIEPVQVEEKMEVKKPEPTVKPTPTIPKRTASAVDLDYLDVKPAPTSDTSSVPATSIKNETTGDEDETMRTNWNDDGMPFNVEILIQKTNRYAGSCLRCGKKVAERQGVLGRNLDVPVQQQVLKAVHWECIEGLITAKKK